jgi:cytochrome c oxidase subunit II
MSSVKLSARICAFFTTFFALLVTTSAQAEINFNMTRGVTPISHQIYGLHMTVFTICVVVGIGVFGVMLYSIFAHRKSKGAVAADFHESTTIEIIWTLVPLAVLIAIAVPATGTLLELEDTSKADVNIQVNGIQWKWKYKYIDEGIEFISSLSEESRNATKNPQGVKNYLRDVDNPIVVPINRKIRFLFTSNDVIHSWWVPALAVKQDVIPGFINDSWALIEEPGVYRGQCAELCGKDHGFMPIVVKAVSQPDYEKWLVAKKSEQAAVAASSSKEWTMDELMTKGEQVYKGTCAACHQPTGLGLPGVFPALAGSPVATGDIKEHINVVMNGRTGTAMAAFKLQLSDADIASAITYERNSFGNTMGDMVQPSTIKSLR